MNESISPKKFLFRIPGNKSTQFETQYNGTPMKISPSFLSSKWQAWQLSDNSWVSSHSLASALLLAPGNDQPGSRTVWWWVHGVDRMQWMILWTEISEFNNILRAGWEALECWMWIIAPSWQASTRSIIHKYFFTVPMFTTLNLRFLNHHLNECKKYIHECK